MHCGSTCPLLSRPKSSAHNRKKRIRSVKGLIINLILSLWTIAAPTALAEEGGTGHDHPGSIASLIDGTPPTQTSVTCLNVIFYDGSHSRNSDCGPQCGKCECADVRTRTDPSLASADQACRRALLCDERYGPSRPAGRGGRCVCGSLSGAALDNVSGLKDTVRISPKGLFPL